MCWKYQMLYNSAPLYQLVLIPILFPRKRRKLKWSQMLSITFHEFLQALQRLLLVTILKNTSTWRKEFPCSSSPKQDLPQEFPFWLAMKPSVILFAKHILSTAVCFLIIYWHMLYMSALHIHQYIR